MLRACSGQHRQGKILGARACLCFFFSALLSVLFGSLATRAPFRCVRVVEVNADREMPLDPFPLFALFLWQAGGFLAWLRTSL